MRGGDKMSLFVFYCCDHVESNTGRKRFIWLTLPLGSQGRNSNRTGTWRQEVKQNQRITTAWLLSLTHSACFLIQPWTSCPGVALPKMVRALPHQSLMEKIPHKLADRVKDFLSRGSLFPDDAHLCQFGKNKTTTKT